MTRGMHGEAGMTLVELLIAMTLMAIGIAAIVAGFSSGIFAIGRADQASTAAVLADQQMEIYRQSSYSALPAPTTTAAVAPSTQPGLDSGNCGKTVSGQTALYICPGIDKRNYWVSTDVAMQCPDGSTPPCTGGGQVKAVTVTVKDGSNPNYESGTNCWTTAAAQTSLCPTKVLYIETSTFEQLAS
jgi:prepilin-type N-terminal cleavage/methylation domain-containing protein